jgi:predicted dehydrogenase
MRFGILGNAKIARTQLIPAILEAGHTVTVIGSRGEANPWAGAPTCRWTDYDGVLNASDVDAVYIALPNHLHADWSVKALRANKHVLCEKPYALSLTEITAVRDAMTASGRCFMEGFMVRHHPQWQWLATQPVGDVRQVQVVFNYNNQNPDNIRNHADMGGGAMWDIGCYAVFAGHWLMGRAPDHVTLNAERHPDWGVDIHSHGLLRWASQDATPSASLQFSVSMQTAKSQSVHIAGTQGWVQLHAPFNPAHGNVANPVHATATWAPEGGLHHEAMDHTFEPCNAYARMVEDFVHTATHDPASGIRDSEAIARTTLRLLESAR